MKDSRVRVLFICSGNSCRSQMAEGLLRTMGKGTVDAYSAGTEPKSVHPLAIQTMRDIDIDISHHRSKAVDEFLEQQFDFVISVCASCRRAVPRLAAR